MIKIQINQQEFIFNDSCNLKYDSRYLSIRHENYIDDEKNESLELEKPKLTLPDYINVVFQSNQNFKLMIKKDKNGHLKICANLI